MKKIDLGQMITILANIGVIAGIVFLALELRQNNELLLAEASYAQFNVQRERRNRHIENTGGIAEILRKSQQGIALTDLEEFRRTVLYEDLLEAWRWEFRELQADRLPDSVMDFGNARNVWQGNPGLADYVESRKSRFSPDFLVFIESNIANR